MNVINDYKCPNGHIEEYYLSSTAKVTTCHCGAEATKVVATPKILLNGSDSGFPGAHDRWLREHERHGNPAP